MALISIVYVRSGIGFQLDIDALHLSIVSLPCHPHAHSNAPISDFQLDPFGSAYLVKFSPEGLAEAAEYPPAPGLPPLTKRRRRGVGRFFVANVSIKPNYILAYKNEVCDKRVFLSRPGLVAFPGRQQRLDIVVERLEEQRLFGRVGRGGGGEEGGVIVYVCSLIIKRACHLLWRKLTGSVCLGAWGGTHMGWAYFTPFLMPVSGPCSTTCEQGNEKLACRPCIIFKYGPFFA